jgi:hypothetical protein
MALPTIPTYLVQNAGGWPDEHNKHPAVDWIHNYEQAFDFGDMKTQGHAPWSTDDFTFSYCGAPSAPAGPAAFAALVERYAPLKAHYHEPHCYLIWENDTGYELTGVAYMYGNFHAPRDDVEKVKDEEGREWDFKGLGSFYFVFVKDQEGPKGLKMKSEVLIADGLPLAKELVKRGMATTEQILA